MKTPLIPRTPLSDQLFEFWVGDENNDGTYTLKVAAGETEKFFSEIKAIELELQQAQAALAALQKDVEHWQNSASEHAKQTAQALARPRHEEAKSALR